MEQIKTVQDLIECYKKLPGVGYRTAERLAYATLNLSKEEKDAFIEAFEEAETKVKKCPNCGTYYDEECPICSDPKRDKTTLLVVKDSKDILSIEKTNGYKGGYFTLSLKEPKSGRYWYTGTEEESRRGQSKRNHLGSSNRS